MEIENRLFLGNRHDAINVSLLKKIHVIINVTKDIDFIDSTKINIRVPINDPGLKFTKDKRYFLNNLDNILKTIKQYISENKNILIHCYAGKQRSASLMLIYLTKYIEGEITREKIDSIEEMLKNKCNAFVPENHFKDVILEYFNL